MNTISLGNAENFGENRLDGVIIRFPYICRVPNLTIEGTITISATGGDLKTHELGENINPYKKDKLVERFRVIAQDEIKIRAEKNSLKNKEDIEITFR
jgi:hypothetical protein